MAQYELNLRDYWQIIQKRRFVLAAIFLAVLLASVVYTNTLKPVYKATASVQWSERRMLGGALTDLVAVSPADPLQTQARIITSLPVLEKAAMELGLVAKELTQDEILQQAASLQDAVKTEIALGSNIINIIVTHKNPRMAADIANKVAAAYIAENLREKTKESRGVREFIERQLKEIEPKLKNSEESLANFKEVETPSGEALPLEANLRDLENERQKLLQQFTPLYPEVKNIEERMEGLKERLKKLPHKELEYSRLGREVEINSKLYRELKDKLESARISEAEKIEDASIVDRAVVPDSPVSPNRPLNYLMGAVIGAILGLASTLIFEQLDTSIGTIEDVEDFLKLPALGIIPYLKVKGEEPRGLIQRLIPKKLKAEEKLALLKKQLVIYYSASSTISEAYRMLRAKIQTEIFKEKIQGKMLLLSSSSPGEGKSITSSNLAVVMAQGGVRTLLIDADMRRSTIHQIFGFKKKEPGLCDILRGTVKPEEAVRTFTDILMGELGFDEALKIPGLDNLSILTSGSVPNIPAELISSGEMSELLDKLRLKFDLILIDSPPVLAVADAVILAPKSDGVILVYKVGSIARSVLARAKSQLIEAGGQVKGIILNNISSEIEMRYGYNYSYKYQGKYYHDEEKT